MGILDEENRLDTGKMSMISKLAKGLELSCHLAFDQTPDPVKALEQIIDLGFSRVLTTGRGTDLESTVRGVSKLVEQARGRIGILPCAGSGVTAENVQSFLDQTGTNEIHIWDVYKEVYLKSGNGTRGGKFERVKVVEKEKVSAFTHALVSPSLSKP